MNIKFTSSKETLPKHGQTIGYWKDEDYVGMGYFPTFHYTTCEWQWDDGNGGAFCHSEEDDYTIDNPPEGFPFLNIICGDSGRSLWCNFKDSDGTVWDVNLWWIDVNELESVLNKNGL